MFLNYFGRQRQTYFTLTLCKSPIQWRFYVIYNYIIVKRQLGFQESVHQINRISLPVLSHE